MAISANNTGILGKLSSIFKSRDPLRREIFQSVSIIDRMLRALEASKKNLETTIEEHKKRLKSHGDDKELAKIIDDEIKNVYGYLSMITKTTYDLAKVKYRLETLLYVEEPLKILPEVLEELRLVEPVIEKINPQLINQVKVLEQRVASIMAMSSSYIPGMVGMISAFQQSASSATGEQRISKGAEIQRASVKEQRVQSATPSLVKSANAKSERSTNNLQTQKTTPVQIPALDKQVPEYSDSKNLVEAGNTAVDIPLHIVEQWILDELRISKGILDVRLFEKKYGVKRGRVLEALRSLEAKNMVRVRRR